MLFTDFLFIPFIFVTLIFYFIFPLRCRWVSLLFFSLFFFATWGIEYIPLVFLITLVAWIGSLIINRRNKMRVESKLINKLILLFSILLILLLLVYVKSQQAMVGTVFEPIVGFMSTVHNALIKFVGGLPFIGDLVSNGKGFNNALLEWIFGPAENLMISNDEAVIESVFFTWIIPIGISYYTLSLIGYLADVYWKKEHAEKNFFKLLLFTLYFPKILEGPISKHRILGSQLIEGHKFDYNRFCFGLQRIIWGFFKKLVIADHLSVFVSIVFNNSQFYTGSEFLVAAVFGAVQLYCDFSGCMDIALGVSECFGITLEENFCRPFASRSAAEFWRRWHISLGAWFKDYVYMPIVVSSRMIRISGWMRKNLGKSGKRVGKAFLTVVPLICVWMLTGLWHGTGKNYMIWGAYWGLLIMLSNIFDPEIRKFIKWLKIDTDSGGFMLFQKSRTFVLFVISRIITIPSTLAVSWYIFTSIFTNFGPWKLVDGSLYNLGIDRSQFIVTMLAIALVGFVGSKQEKGIRIREWIAARPLPIRWAIYYAAIVAVLIFGAYGPGYDASAFVYMRY